MEENFLIKGIYEIPTADFVLNGERLKLSSWDQKQGKDVHSNHFYSTLLKGSNQGFKVN